MSTERPCSKHEFPHLIERPLASSLKWSFKDVLTGNDRPYFDDYFYWYEKKNWKIVITRSKKLKTHKSKDPSKMENIN